MIRVLLRQDPSLLSTALARALSIEHGMVVIGSLARNAGLDTVGRRLAPDVVVVDGSRDTVEAVERECRALCEALPESNVLVMLGPGGPVPVQEGLARLAPRVGFMTTAETCDRLVDAVRRLAGGGTVIGADVALAAFKARDNPLTGREREVLGLAVTGASTQEIADSLYLSVGTVRNYLSNAIGKTGARTRIDAIRIAQEAGWL